MSIWLMIALMALVTYLPRYLPMAMAGRVRLPGPVEQALDFVPIAVLTAIVARATLARGDALDFSLENLHALAALTAFGAALLWRRLFVTIAVGLGSFVLLRLLL